MVQVAIDAGPLHGARTGIGNAVAWTIEALRRTSRTDDDLELLPYVTSMRAKLGTGERRLPIPAALAHRTWARSNVPRMDRFLGRPDVVHGTNYVVPPTSAPRLVSVYDCWFLDHPDDAHPDVARAGAVLRRSIADGAQVVTSSDATTERVRELLDAPSVHTVHLGPPPHDADERRSAPALGDPDAPFILALGTVERRKNLPTLIAAFARLAEEHPAVQLRIAGRDGDDSAALAKAIEGLTPATRKRVVRHPTVTEPVKRWLLDRAVTLAYPSLDEGFGFPILEAQQAGTPVVASSAGSIPEVAGAGALLSLPLDDAALAANLFWAISSDAKREELITRGHANAERFSWDRTAERLTDLYRRLATENET
ncbi:glycosyltransferase family 4 protein [Ilumatobacter nonamiensis]|uniref:glycosyltransferase family 4 protein n=1 Tax=Ilumatobacter nonamiensis TaxID=467093 RepID=UPI00034DA13F|nr:glycosyltransferase family 1 protein [Ilumatobacter nonamiensis]